MSDRSAFSDEELTAYLDGAADPALRADIERALGGDPGLRERLEALSVDVDAIRGAFDDLLNAAPPVPDSLADGASVQAARPRVGWAASLAAAVALLLLGGLAGSFISREDPQTWRAYAAAYHALYVEETLSHVATSAASAEADLARVSATLGKTLELADVSGVAGFDFKRAQVLGYEGRPLIQLAFLTEAGDPIALCIFGAGDKQTADLVTARMEGMSAASWAQEGFEYLLVGGRDDAAIRRAAQAFQTAL